MKDFLGLRRVFIAVIAIGLFAMCLRPMADPDVWWHLRTGELIHQNHHVFHNDPYSVGFAGKPWINHEWLFDVLLFTLYRTTSASGLIVLFALISIAAFFLVYRGSPGKPYVAGMVVAVAAAAAIPSFGVRPQILSLLLTAMFLRILHVSRERTQTLWWLIVIMALWVNLHAGYALGPALILIVLLGELLDAVFGVWEGEVQPRRTQSPAEKYPVESAVKPAVKRVGSRLRDLALVFAACMAVVPLNPNGFRLYTYPLQTLTSPSMQAYIQEWFSPDFHRAEYAPLLALILTILFAAAFSTRRLKPSEFLLLGAGMFAALRSARHIPIFALVAIPILSSQLADLPWVELMRNRKGSTSPGKYRQFTHALILAAAIAFCGVRVHAVLTGQFEAETKNFPEAASTWILAHRPPAPILNHYNWGGYLVWKLYPEYRVFIDGRADLYGDKFMNDIAMVYYLQDGWQPIFESWRIRTIFLPPDAPLVTALSGSQDWSVIYRDEQAVILTSNFQTK